MELIKKLFGRPPDPAAADESAQFHDSESSTETGSRNAPRRELVHVVLRDSMRRHGIPSAWIECRILSVRSRNSRTGMHVQLIVRDGVDRLLTYVPAFQTSFMQEISRFDPRVEDWLFSVSWQFHNLAAAMSSSMPDPAVWSGSAPPSAAVPAPARPVGVALKEAAPPPSAAPAATLAPLPPSPVHSASADTATPGPASVDGTGDDDVMDDLRALYAIRDAALGRPAGKGPSGESDFESTRPGTDPDPPALPGAQPRRW